MPPRTAIRSLLCLLALVSTLLLTTGCGAAQADVTVQAATTGRTIPSGFVGLSMELRGLAEYAGSDPKAIDPAFLALVSDIAPGQSPVLRIGGDSSDWTWWPVPGAPTPPGVRYTLTPNYLSVAHSVASALRAHLIMGINLEANNPRDAAAEGRAFVDRIGRRYLEALEIGNEPELYSSFAWYHTASGRGVLGRPPGYTETDYERDFANVVHVMPRIPIAGPSSGAPTYLANLGAFLRGEPRVKVATIHAYPLKHCRKSTVITIPELLANSSAYGFARALTPYVEVAHRNGKQIRIDELNGVSCGGARGVSNAFASALWVLDTLFELTRTGVDGVNIHTVPGITNEILGPSYAHGQWSVRVHPEYYGVIMFAQAAPAGSRLLALSAPSPSGVHTWATRAPDGDVRVVLINDRSRRPVTMRIRVPSVRGSGTLERLRGPSLGATQGVSLGGAGFGAATTTGRLAGKVVLDTVKPAGRAYTVTLPAASAALLTLAPSGTPATPAGLG